MVRFHGAGTPGQQLAAASAHQNWVKVLSISQGTPPQKLKKLADFFPFNSWLFCFISQFLFFSSLLGQGIPPPNRYFFAHTQVVNVFFLATPCFS
jgi:hypothetical protein